MHYHLNHNPHQFFTYHLIFHEKYVLTCAKLSSFLLSSPSLAICFYRHESPSTPRIKVVRFGVEELFITAKGTLFNSSLPCPPPSQRRFQDDCIIIQFCYQENYADTHTPSLPV